MMPTPHGRRFRHILAAVDFSRPSAKAVRYAAAVARAGGGRVVALHAIDPLLSAAAARAYAGTPLIAETRAALRKFVRSAIGADAAATVDCVVTIGSPTQTLLAECRRLKADIIVVGTNGRGGIPKAFFGSTTQGLLRRHPGALMVIPPGCPNPSTTWPGPSVLAAIGQGAHRRAMMHAAVAAADLLGAWLTGVDADAALSRAARDESALILLPMPAEQRVKAFRQGTAAYRFVCRTRRPVLVLHTGRRIGHAALRGRAASARLSATTATSPTIACATG